MVHKKTISMESVQVQKKKSKTKVAKKKVAGDKKKAKKSPRHAAVRMSSSAKRLLTKYCPNSKLQIPAATKWMVEDILCYYIKKIGEQLNRMRDAEAFKTVKPKHIYQALRTILPSKKTRDLKQIANTALDVYKKSKSS